MKASRENTAPSLDFSKCHLLQGQDDIFISPQLILPEISWHTCTETGLLVDSRATQADSKDQPSRKQPEAIFKTYAPAEHHVPSQLPACLSRPQAPLTVLPLTKCVSGAITCNCTFSNHWFPHLTLAVPPNHTAGTVLAHNLDASSANFL